MHRWDSHGLARLAGLLIFLLIACVDGASATAPDAPQGPIVESSINSLPCPEGTVARAARALHFAGNADFWEKGPDIDCQLDPAHPHRAIVALSYIHGEERSGMRQDSFTGDPRDLDLVVWDLDGERILAHRHDDRAIQDDAEHLESMSIDTGSYSLSPSRRAFGILTANATHCTCDNSSNVVLTLYLQDGDHLDRILAFTPHSWEGDPNAGVAAGSSCDVNVESSTSLTMGHGSSHGLTDLVLTTTRTPQYNTEGTLATCPPLKPEKKTLILHFDGKDYARPPGNSDNSETGSSI
jgi:hypothetical protein